jgi:hypothetical protein
VDPLKTIAWIVTGIIVGSVLFVVLSACMLSSKLSREDEAWDAWLIYQEQLRQASAAAQLTEASRPTMTETMPGRASRRASDSRRNHAK